MSERLLRVPEVSERLGMSRTTVYELIARGIIPSVAIGGTRTRRVREADLDEWIRTEAAAAATPVPAA